MQLKRTWSGKNGKETAFTVQDSPMKAIEMDFLNLCDGQSVSYDEKDREFALILLGGKCTVQGKEFRFEKIGERATPFDGKPVTAFIGANTPFSVMGEGDVRIAVCKSPAKKTYPPRVIGANEVREKTLGKGSFERLAYFNLDETVPAEALYIGEFLVSDGRWASFPPHKHDVDNMPAEGKLEEVYYFEFDKPAGFGVQMVYDREGEFDLAYRVQSGDMVLIPKGYHPCAVAPGYTEYCLWVMAGKDRGLFSSMAPEHAWIVK